MFLEKNGFKKYFPNGSQIPTLVYVYQNKVVETSIEKIKDFVLSYLMKPLLKTKQNALRER